MIYRTLQCSCIPFTGSECDGEAWGLSTRLSSVLHVQQYWELGTGSQIYVQWLEIAITTTPRNVLTYNYPLASRNNWYHWIHLSTMNTEDISNHDKRPLSGHTSLVYPPLWAAAVLGDACVFMHQASSPCKWTELHVCMCAFVYIRMCTYSCMCISVYVGGHSCLICGQWIM